MSRFKVSTSPVCCQIRITSSSVETARARGKIAGSRSITRQRRPCAPSRCAAVTPVGPYPTIATSYETCAIRLPSPRSASAADQPRYRFGSLAHLVFGLPTTLARRVDHTVREMLLEQLQRERLQCLRGGGHLREDVDAVLVVLDHALQSAHLTFNPAQTFQVRVPVGRVSPCDLVSHRVP